MSQINDFMSEKANPPFCFLIVAILGFASPVAFAADENHFDLLELRVKGNTLLERKSIERTVYPFLGKNKDIDTVEKARTALEESYHSKGYQTVAVDIPEQDVVGGVVLLQVTEGKVSRLRVTDSRYFSLGSIKSKVPELAEGKVPNMPVMQQQMTELSKQSPDRTVVPILRAGEAPGTLEVDLKVKDTLPIHGKVEVNSNNVANTSRLRTIASLRYDNLWQKFHSASFMYQTSPEKPNEVEVFVGTYVMPVFETDTKLALYGVRSASDSLIPSTTALGVLGNGEIYGARVITPLQNRGNYSHTFTTGLDYKNFKENLRLIGNDSLQTPISYLPLMAQYTGNLSGDKYWLSFNAGLNFSVRGLANDAQEFANKRFGASPSYIIFNGGLDYKYKLPWGMDFDSRISGQVSDSPLVSNEQFSLGGVQTVRGYFETQALSDDGIQGTLELYSPRIVPTDGDWESINILRGLVFLEAGQGWSKNVLPGVNSKVSLASGGFGVRFKALKYLNANLDIAFPFISQGTIISGDPRLHFRVAAEF